MANIADGVFSFVGDTLEIISAPNVTRDMYARFAEVVAKAQSGEIGKQEFAAAAEEISPEFGKAAKIATARWSAITLFLLMLIIQRCSINLDVKIDANAFLDQLFGGNDAEYILPRDKPAQEGESEVIPENPYPTKERPNHKHRQIEASLIKQNKAKLLNTVFSL